MRVRGVTGRTSRVPARVKMSLPPQEIYAHGYEGSPPRRAAQQRGSRVRQKAATAQASQTK